MERPSRHKAKNKKQPAAKPKTAKKRKSDGPTCSMFLAELTRKLAAKRREELELPTNIIQSIIESITNALPIKIVIKSTPSPAPIEPKASILEELCSLSPELVPNDTISITPRTVPVISNEVLIQDVDFYATEKFAFKMPKMPVVDSEIMKTAAERETRRRRTAMIDAATTTAVDHDVASELTRHVTTLRKISLIAEEFNQKTAKSLKEIVDSVQEDLIKKLEEVQAEQRARAQSLAIQEEAEEKIA